MQFFLFFFMNIDFVTCFEVVKFIRTRSACIGEHITVHLNSNCWLRWLSKFLLGWFITSCRHINFNSGGLKRYGPITYVNHVGITSTLVSSYMKLVGYGCFDLSTRWLANLICICSHLPPDFLGSYEYRLHYGNEDSRARGHVGPPQLRWLLSLEWLWY